MKNLRYLSFFAIILFCLLLFSACRNGAQDRKPPRAVKGVLDLSGWNLAKDGPVDLSGEYEFYWMQHLTPADFSKTIPLEKTGFIKVPGYWNSFKLDGVELPGVGYATYRLTIILSEPWPYLAIKFLEMSTAFDIYVDNQKIISVGSAGFSRETTLPQFLPNVVDFENNRKIIHIIYHVSNFHHRRAGAWETIKFGLEKDIRDLFNESLSIDLFLFGSIFIMGLYHLGLFLLRVKDRSPLYFSLICFLISLRLLTTGERYIVHFFPQMDWEIMIKLEYLSFYMAIPIFAKFMQSLFSDFSKWFLHSVVIIGIIVSAIVFFTPARIYSYSLPLYEVTTIVVFIYGLYVLVVSMFKINIEAYVFFFGFMVLSFTVINDILHVERLIQTRFMAPFGLFMFILFQAFLLSFRFDRALTAVEAQTVELRDTLESYKQEIIERVEAEEALRASHERFMTVLDSIDADIYVVNMETFEIIFMNKHMRESFGDDSIGEICWKTIGGRSMRCELCSQNLFVDADSQPTGIFNWEEKNPITDKWYMKHGRAIKWDGERLVLLQVAMDISELKHTLGAFRESEEKYRTILQSIEEGYYEVDLSGNMTFFNNSMCHILGYTADELMGMNNRQYMSAETADQFYQIFNQVYRTGVPTSAVDWETVRQDGQVNVIEISVSLIRDHNGQAVGFRGIAHDITARKRAEDLAKLHQHQLMQASKMVAVGALVAGVAHEINNPNNFIMMNSNIVKEAWQNAIPILEDYYRENGDFLMGGLNYTEMRSNIPALFEGINDGARRIKQIVDDLKTYVREDVADMTQEVDITEVINSAVSFLSYMIKNSTRDFHIHYEKDLPRLRGNFQRLEQVIINLIQNACQALPDNEKGISVVVKYEASRAAVVITIRDEGVGMAPETINAIVDPFFTTRADAGGVGLGLTISSRIAEEHGGQINFTSTEGSGTVAEIVLPVHFEHPIHIGETA